MNSLLNQTCKIVVDPSYQFRWYGLFIALICILFYGCEQGPDTLKKTSGQPVTDSIPAFLSQPEYAQLAKELVLIDELFDSLDVALQKGDFGKEARLKTLLANQFRLSGNYPVSVRFYTEAGRALGKDPPAEISGEIEHGLAAVYYEYYYHDTVKVFYLDSADYYAGRAYRTARENANYKLSMDALNVQGAVQIQKRNYPAALDLLKRAFQIAEEQGYDPGLAAKVNLAYVYFMISDYVQALDISEAAYMQSLEEGNAVFAGILLDLMTKVYRATGDMVKADASMEKLREIVGEKDVILQALAMQQQLLNYQLRLEKNEISGLYQERFLLIRSSRILIAGILVLLIATMVLLKMFRQNKKMIDKEAELKAERQKATDLQLQNAALEVKARKAEAKALQVDLEAKNMALATKLLNLSKVNEFLSVLRQNIRQMIDHPDRKPDEAYLKELDHKISVHLNTKVWEEFELLYVSGGKSFVSRLTEVHPDLTTNDKRLCYLILSDLTTKEISDIMSKSYRSVEMARHRLRNKLGIDHNSSLRDYLLKFAN
jgi:DNA-binding CsgD family transcriptional regulator